MPKPFVPSATANATTITRRVASSIKTQYHHSSTTQTSKSRRHALNNTHQCRCQCRHFSQLTPKPLARLHDRREIDAIFFSRSSSITLHSSNKRQKDERSKNRVAVETGQTVSYDLPPGTEGVGGGDHKPPDERVVRLGKTLRKLSPLLPNILIHPLPTELLSPQITLHLFPSTHPHLPTVKGRVLYRAALWTVPVAWSSLPLLGNVKLEILSERMVRADSVLGYSAQYNDASVECGEERLVVRWKTSHNTPTSESSPSSSTSSTSESRDSGSVSRSKSGVNKSLSTLLGGDAPIFLPGKEGRFEGLFIFAFDEKGRIAGHTIEHADQADGWDRTAKFVTLTDWLLGKARGSLGEPAAPALAHSRHPHDQQAYCRGYGSKEGELCYHDGMKWNE